MTNSDELATSPLSGVFPVGVRMKKKIICNRTFALQHIYNAIHNSFSLVHRNNFLLFAYFCYFCYFFVFAFLTTGTRMSSFYVLEKRHPVI